MAENLSAFFAENAVTSENLKVVASKRFIDPKTKKPLEWEVAMISAESDEALRKECIRKSPIAGKRGMKETEFDNTKYIGKLCAKCTLYPDLNDAGLQDSYGVKSADALLKKMLNVGEYTEYQGTVMEFNGFDLTMDDKVEEAKN